MHYILLIILITFNNASGTTISQYEYNTEEACKLASDSVIHTLSNGPSRQDIEGVYSFCMKKG